MIREIRPGEMDEWVRRLNAEWRREQEALGNKTLLTFGGFVYGAGHYILDDEDETVVMHFDPGAKGDVFVPWLLGRSERIDSNELFRWAIDYLQSKGYVAAVHPSEPGTNGEKATRATKGQAVGRHVRVNLAAAKAEINKARRP